MAFEGFTIVQARRVAKLHAGAERSVLARVSRPWRIGKVERRMGPRFDRYFSQILRKNHPGDSVAYRREAFGQRGASPEGKR